MKVHTWDTVKVTTGKDNWKEGKILSVNTKTGRVIVEGVNIVTRHVKKQGTNPGQIVKSERSIDASNVMLLEGGKPTRIGYKFENDKKVRFAKKSGKSIK
ncbi:MAG: 50S ribosomal protein L24 [uncultured bacterium (gcode 4)]|uniref:Large ribosomal subunit protein uL24 n=1 Tax=uncultured bacterium (gcode 4) TaxID=1234023 RepID=K2GDC7_9BACT|nr:MAG: 50S ribosomal protein L24 [uncultured bacterium (gcode 4)]